MFYLAKMIIKNIQFACNLLVIEKRKKNKIIAKVLEYFFSRYLDYLP